MSFGSPNNKLFSPSNNSNQYSQKSYGNSVNVIPTQNAPIQLKPGTVSMGFIIESVALKSYTDFSRLVETLPSKEDIDKKKEIATFLSRTRNTLIRLQSLYKWNPSAVKVDKCDKISNLLDEQSSFLIKTAEELSIMAYDKLPMARLHNLLPMIAADILASKTYSRLPNQIRLPVLRSQVISRADKARMLLEIDRVLRIRVSNSRLPYRMRKISIGDGRVTFTVADEFKVTCTLLSDHFDHPWHLLDIRFLVRGNNVCRGRSLMHSNQLRTLHDMVQTRLEASTLETKRPSLFHLYDMLHAMAVSMQLEVLHEQTLDYVNHQHGVPILELKYTRSKSLSFTYWHRHPDKYAASGRPKHTIVITPDSDDSQRPLKVKHQPTLSSDNKYSEKQLDTGNLSIKNLIAESITIRIFSTLQMVQRLLFPFIHGNILISSTNPVLLVPILDIEGKNGINHLKIQINSSNGFVKTSFEITLDRMRGFVEDKISDILLSLDNDLNDLLMKSYNTMDNIYASSSVPQPINRDLINHRRNISSSLNKLRVILTKYHCLSVLQRAGFNDLHLLLARPPICREKSGVEKPETGSSSLIYTLLAQEATGDCDLIFVPINSEWHYYLVIVCETKFRLVPFYRVYGLCTSKVYSTNVITTTSSNNNNVTATAGVPGTTTTTTTTGATTTVTVVNYMEKQWTLRPVKLSLITSDVIGRMKNINLTRYTSENRGNPRKRSAPVTCTDLLHKIHSKNQRSDDGTAHGTDDATIVNDNDRDSSQFPIGSLPAVIGYMKDNIIFKLLLHEIERRSFVFESERINEDIYVHSCKITKFPLAKGCSGRATNLMNKLLAHCTITYFTQPQDCDGSSQIRWEAHYFLASPLILFDKSLTKSKLYSKKIVLCSKKCIEENSTGIKEAVEMVQSFWEEMCSFCDTCLLPLVDKAQSQQLEVKLIDYQFNQLSFTYGNDNQYKVTLCFSLKAGFTVSTAMSASYIVSSTTKHTVTTNPHNMIRKDLDNYLNSHRNINVLTKVILDTLEFLAIVQPFNNSTLMVMQDNGSTHLLRNYSLIVLDAYHVVLVFRERFALNIILNNETHTVLLSDAHNNFHACNVSISEMPLFNDFMVSLEDSFKINIEDEVWSGLFVDQLGIVLGSNNEDKKISSPLENYLLSCLQLGSRREISSPLPCCNEAHIIAGNELKIGMVVSKNETIPFWSLGLTVESVKTESPWLLDPEMLSMAKVVLETKIRAPKLPESGINIFRKLLQLPSFNLQKNILTILTKAPTIVEIESGKVVANLDLDWANVQEAISQPQEPSSIMLRFVLNLKVYGTEESSPTPATLATVTMDNGHHRSLNLALVVHYAAKSNQISILNGTCAQVIRQNLDKEANEMVVGQINGDTPLIIFFGKLMASLSEYID